MIWKLAYDKGVFQWFQDHGRKGATVRQVRLDSALLCLVVIQRCCVVIISRCEDYTY